MLIRAIVLTAATVLIPAACLAGTVSAAGDDRAAPSQSTASQTISPGEAARMVSTADSAFRQGQIGDALRSCLSLLSVFPTWWIPSAKAAVALVQSGRAIDDVIKALEKTTEFAPTGAYLPMLRVLAAAERMNTEDASFIIETSRIETSRPAEAIQPFMRSQDDDLPSRYTLIRAMALQKAAMDGMAIQEYRNLISSRPFAITPKIKLAGLLSSLGRNDDATALLEGVEGASLMPGRIRVLKQQMKTGTNGRSNGSSDGLEQKKTLFR